MDDQDLATIRSFYDQDVARRAATEYPAWKRAVRQDFLARLQAEGARNMLEIGAGTGRDAAYFQDAGLRVTCTDLSPAMVAQCQSQGLAAYVMDFWHLTFPPDSFDALYALNCLLHVPGVELSDVMQRLRVLVRPGGLLFVGVYGGEDREFWTDTDGAGNRRFFAYHTDIWLRDAIAQWFTVENFTSVLLPADDQHDDPALHFQACVARRPIP